MKFLFDEFSRCLEVPSHEQTLPFFPFRSKDYSEYKRIFVDAKGAEQSKEENQQVRLDTMQKLLKLKIVKECYISD